MPEYPLWDPTVQRPDLGHYVYRFHDSEGALLYVGSTGNLWYRIGQHAAEREWWPDVAWDLTVAELISAARCPGRGCSLPGHAEMLCYEERLIKELQPRHNRLMTGYCRRGLHLIAEDAKPDGKGRYTCGACVREWHRQHYLDNREERLAASAAYYLANRDKVREYRRQPEVQARTNARMQEYRSRPENRDRANALRRLRYAERKAAAALKEGAS